MKLALQHTDESLYPRCGIFIKDASPSVWLKEITRMQLKLSECTVYPCPAMEANSISGVLIIFNTAQRKIDVRNHISVQKVYTGFYIPENTQLNMSLTQEEYVKILQSKPHFFHHEYGLMELKEAIQWETLLQLPEEQFPKIETPAKGVNIPMRVTAFSVEIEEKETEKALNNPLGDEKIDTEDLPFEMKKVLEGNNKEVEKYLKYIEKNPEAALKMALPLDMLGTSRGKAFAKYKFKSNFFDTIGFGNTSERTKTGFKTIVGIIAIIGIFWLGALAVDAYKKNQVEIVRGTGTIKVTPTTDTEDLTAEQIRALESANGNSGTNSQDNTVLTEGSRRSDSNYENTNSNDTDEVLKLFLLSIIFIVAFIFIGYLIVSRKKKHTKATLKNNAKAAASSSWMNLPEESELFSFTDEPKKRRGYNFYFGGDELSVRGKILLIFILFAAIAYLLYPMLTDRNTKTIFIIIFVGIIIRTLFFLLNKNKSLKDD